MKSTWVFLRKFLVNLFSKVTFLPALMRSSMMRREMKMEVSTEVTIPMIRVVAKPLMGPEPKKNSTIPVSKVVT